MNIKQTPILIVGLPRSGTTWFGEVLSSAHGTSYIFEPDNESLHPTAWWGKQNVHRFPYLTASDVPPKEYLKLWDVVVNGHPWVWQVNAGVGYMLRRKLAKTLNFRLEAHVGEKCNYRYIDPSMYWVGTHLVAPHNPGEHFFSALVARALFTKRMGSYARGRSIIKSVHSSLSLDWLSSIFPVQVIVVLRNPYSLFASYKRMKLPDGVRNVFSQPALYRDISLYMPGDSQFPAPDLDDLIACQIMLMYKVIEKHAEKHPKWMLISHDRLCVNPHDDYKNIFDNLKLDWSSTTARKIDSLNKQGKGFEPSRVSSQQPFKWKSELAQRQQRVIEDWMDRFELRRFFHEKVNL